MRKIFVILLLVFGVTLLISFTKNYSAKNQVEYNNQNDSLKKDRAKYIAIINNQIKGKEKMQVDSVFENLKVLGGFPAENLVFAMEAWSKGLGVSCGHCHNTTNFASDEKPKKEISREMVKMGNMISTQIRTIKGLSERPIVNCITCHRGALKPAYRMPEK